MKNKALDQYYNSTAKE